MDGGREGSWDEKPGIYKYEVWKQSTQKIEMSSEEQEEMKRVQDMQKLKVSKGKKAMCMNFYDDALGFSWKLGCNNMICILSFIQITEDVSFPLISMLGYLFSNSLLL